MKANLKVVDAKWGYIKVSDGTFIRYRVAVVDAKPLEGISPFGVEFDMNIATGVSVYPSDESLKEIESKPFIKPGTPMPKDGWKQVKIEDKDVAVEEVEFYDEKLGRYKIKVEIEPAMVVKNTEFKSISGEPLYVVRWIPKVVWNKME